MRTSFSLLALLAFVTSGAIGAACAPSGMDPNQADTGDAPAGAGAGQGTGGAPSGSASGGSGSGGESTGPGPGSGGSSDCGPGTADCNADAADGCEADTATDEGNCGGCGVVCAMAANALVTCEAGACVMACQAGYQDCNGDMADGCEALLTNDPQNCGACGTVCPPGPSIPALCVASECTLDCGSGSGSCDGNAANGCETNLDTSGSHCGGCGIDCGGAPCVSGACACATETQQAEQLQLDLFIMLDQSGSMDEAVQAGGTKWEAVTTALDGFFADPQNAGLGVGIQYFALPPLLPPPVFCSSDADCGLSAPCQFGLCLGSGGSNGPDSCNGADYAIAAVGIAPLTPAHAATLSANIGAHAPSTDTPTAAALKGAIHHAKTWASNHPGHAAVVVLATDGEPTECFPLDLPGIAGIAAAGVNGSPSVKTFVIGVGQLLSNLNTIAAGGGTGQAYLVDTNQNVVQQFQAALQSIQQTALGCEFVIPQPSMGTLDYGKVNVQYTPGGGNPILIGNVPNLAGCDPQNGGWYYDNNATPTKIVLCPVTCSTVSADPSGKIDILLGCDTVHD